MSTQERPPGHVLEIVTQAPDPEVIETLEEALAIAREGRLLSVAVIGEVAGGGTTTAYGLGRDACRARLHFALATAMHRLVEEW